jgi:ATP synthase (E/31 kDa) subunit
MEATADIQGFYALMDKELFIQCHKEDIDLIKEAVKEAEEEFEKNAG